MSERYCPKCAAEVPDLGGYCALGHSLMLRPISEITNLGDLKAEVNKAFAEAELQVASVLAAAQGAVTGEMPAVPTHSPTLQTPPPPPPARYADEFDEYDEAARVRSQTFWQTLDDDDPEPSRTDPITAFAPAPRMDWGPDKSPAKKTRRKP